MTLNIPINKGNYSLDTVEREREFTEKRAFGVEKEYYENRRQWNDYPKNLTVADYPLLVDLELSSLCNLNCPFCYTKTAEFKSKVQATFMDFELFKKIIDEISGNVFAVRLSLRGEPTLHPRFIDAISYAKQHGIGEVSTLTNGSHLRESYFIDMMNAGIDWVTVSFDGLAEEYEKNRYPLKYEAIYGYLKRIKEIKEEHGRIKPVIKVQAVWPSIKDDPELFYNTMKQVSDLVAFNPIIDYTEQDVDDSKYEPDFCCSQLYQRLVIGADGLVMMCSNDENGTRIIGNAHHESIHSLWHGQKLQAIRDQHKKREGYKAITTCRHCYLPRRTREDTYHIGKRPFIVYNYI